MKHYVKYFILLCLLIANHASWGQSHNFAGRDTTILRKPENLQTVWLGVADDDYCYDWDVALEEHILSYNRHAGRILYNAIFAEEVITVSRVTLNGVEEDQVKVTVKDSVVIESVTFNKKCYNDGDWIKKEDFTIVTFPRGYEDEVQLLTPIAKNIFGRPEDLQEVVFKISKNGHENYDTINITVYNTTLGFDYDVSVNPKKFKDFTKLIPKAKLCFETFKTVKTCLDQIKDATPTPGRLPKADFSFDLTLPLPHPYDKCCDGVDKHGVALNILQLSGTGSIELYFHLLGIPYVAELSAFLNISAGLSFLGRDVIFSDDDLCDPTGLQFCLNAEVSGGLDGYVLHPDVLNAKAAVFGGFSQCVSVFQLLTDKKMNYAVSPNIGLRLRVTFLDFATKELRFTLWSRTLTLNN